MGLKNWLKRNNNDNQNNQISNYDEINGQIINYLNTSATSKHLDDIAQQEAQDLLLKSNKDPKEKLSSLYKNYKLFIKEISSPQESKQKSPDIHSQKSENDSYEFNYEDLNYLYNITPPNHINNTQTQKDEQVKKYKNLCAKGYINTDSSKKLILPYLLEKKKNGMILTENEQQILDKNKETIAADYTKSVLILQAIGLIKDYRQDFPETSIEANFILGINYCLYPATKIENLSKALANEANSPNPVNQSSDIPYFVAEVLDDLKSGDLKIPKMQSLINKGLIENGGTTIEDVKKIDKAYNKYINATSKDEKDSYTY